MNKPMIKNELKTALWALLIGFLLAIVGIAFGVGFYEEASADTFNVPSASYEGYIRGSGTDWADLLPYDSASGAYSSYDTFLARIRGTTGGSWSFWEQGKICFDTSSLDGTEVIDSASLWVYVVSKNTTISGQYINIYDEAGDDTVSTDDAWDANLANVLASVSVDSFASSGWAEIVLDETYLDLNDVGNTCLLGINKAQAQSESEPSGASDDQAFILIDDFATNAPYLDITFGASEVCGNGVIEGDEQCDDNDTDSGDGCSNICEIEYGYDCTGEPSVCSTTCGDGEIAGAETCDDGNTENGDGCSSICAVQSGWSCVGEPSVCNEDITCWESCEQANPPASQDFDYGTTCGSGDATAYPESAEPSCVRPCYACVAEELEEHYFEFDDECGIAPADYYPFATPPYSCDNITCWESCADGGDSQEFVTGTTCGLGDAVDYPKQAPPYCAGVLCYKSCDDGLEYDVFDFGTTCGSGDAVDYPLDTRPYCNEYYSFNCNEYYFMLCTSQTTCEALGSEFVWDNGSCKFLPLGSASFSTELEALTALSDQMQGLESTYIGYSRQISFAGTITAYLVSFIIFVLIAWGAHRFLTGKKKTHV